MELYNQSKIETVIQSYLFNQSEATFEEFAEELRPFILALEVKRTLEKIDDPSDALHILFTLFTETKPQLL